MNNTSDKQSQQTVPQGWKEVRLGDENISKYINESISIKQIHTNNYISTDNILANLGGIEKSKNIPSAHKVKRFKKEDILFSNIRTYFRKVWFANIDGGCSNDVLVFRTEGINSKFLYYVLADNNFIDYSGITSKGTKMPRGDKKAIQKYKFNLPLIPEQKAIASILGTLDDKIELNRQINETLEAMALKKYLNLGMNSIER